MIRTVLQRLNSWGPVFFGVCFIAPLLAALLVRTGLETSFGLPPVLIGLMLGATWGLYAKTRGSWL